MSKHFNNVLKKPKHFFMANSNSLSKFGYVDFLQKIIEPVSQDLHGSLTTGVEKESPDAGDK